MEVAILVGLAKLGHGFEIPHAVNNLVDIVVAVIRSQSSKDEDALTRMQNHASANHFA